MKQKTSLNIPGTASINEIIDLLKRSGINANVVNDVEMDTDETNENEINYSDVVFLKKNKNNFYVRIVDDNGKYVNLPLANLLSEEEEQNVDFRDYNYFKNSNPRSLYTEVVYNNLEDLFRSYHINNCASRYYFSSENNEIVVWLCERYFAYKVALNDMPKKELERIVRISENSNNTTVVIPRFLENTNVCYSRLSSIAQNNDSAVSLEMQQSAIINALNFDPKFANPTNMPIFIKEISSGRNAGDDNKQLLLKLVIRMMKNSKLIVYSVDRFTRNTEFGLNVLTDLTKDQNILFSISEGVSWNTTTDKNIIRSSLSVSEMQSDTISDKVKRSYVYRMERHAANAANANQQRLPKRSARNKRKYGLTPCGKKIPSEQEIIKEIKRMKNENASSVQIASFLNRKNIKYFNSKWNHYMVQTILQNI